MNGKDKHLLFIGIGVVFMLLGLWGRYDTQKFLENAVTADGIVVDVTSHQTGSSRNRRTVYEPIVEFKDARGELVSFVGPEMSEDSYVVGDAVEVLYEEDAPEEARVNTLGGTWGALLLTPFFAVFFVVKGAGSLLWLRLFPRR